jgi:ABC-2 type transport system permease protein
MLVRYFRLYLYFIRFAFSKAMEFRIDFTFRIIMDIAWCAAQIVFFLVLYRHTDTIGGWTFDQVFIFAASYMYLDAVNMTLFASNLWWFPIYVNRGDLDYHLVRPVSTLFLVGLKEFAANSLVNLLLAGALLAYTLLRYPGHLPLSNVLLFICFLHLGALIYLLFHALALIPVFWLHQIDGLRNVAWQLEQFVRRPDQIFHGWTRRLLVSVLPLALVASFPNHLLHNGFDVKIVAPMIVVFLIGYTFMLWFWGKGLRAYSSASS